MNFNVITKLQRYGQMLKFKGLSTIQRRLAGELRCMCSRYHWKNWPVSQRGCFAARGPMGGKCGWSQFQHMWKRSKNAAPYCKSSLGYPASSTVTAPADLSCLLVSVQLRESTFGILFPAHGQTRGQLFRGCNSIW